MLTVRATYTEGTQYLVILGTTLSWSMEANKNRESSNSAWGQKASLQPFPPPLLACRLIAQGWGKVSSQLYLKMWTPSWKSGEQRNGVGVGAPRCKVKVFPDTGISSLWKQSKRKFSLWVKRRILSIALKPLGSLRSGRAWKAAQKFRSFSHETGISSAEGVSGWDLWSLYELWLANDEVGEAPRLCFLNLIQCVRNSEEKKMNLLAAERDLKVPTTAWAHASSSENFSYRQKLKWQKRLGLVLINWGLCLLFDFMAFPVFHSTSCLWKIVSLCALKIYYVFPLIIITICFNYHPPQTPQATELSVCSKQPHIFLIINVLTE